MSALPFRNRCWEWS